MWSSFYRSLIAVVACLVFGFPIAYFLALKVNSLRNQIALFIIALAPFWTSTLTRSIAWTFPLIGREGAINQIGDMIGWWGPDNPLIEPLSETSVLLAMIQLYILFMITPLFFTLSQVDRTALEAARDLGGNWWRTFREVILPADDARRRHRLDLHLRSHHGRLRDREARRRQPSRPSARSSTPRSSSQSSTRRERRPPCCSSSC